MVWNNIDRKILYRTFADMKQRCYNPKCKMYKYYGARGIRVCDEWLNSFDQFAIDMGVRPDGLSIERKDVNGNYSPENCKWATASEQRQNQRGNVLLEKDGRIQTLEVWAREIGRHPTTLRSRIKHGWPIESILCPDNLQGDPNARHKAIAAMKAAK